MSQQLDTKYDPKRPVVVVFSGGQDSTTVLYGVLQKADVVYCLTFNYNQRHAREIQAALTIVVQARITYPDKQIYHELIEIGGEVLKGSSPLVSDAPLEQYTHHSSLPGGLEKTFVPMRNQLFLTIAANRAVCVGARDIFTGVSMEDFGGYPDCRQAFINALNYATNESLEGVQKIRIVTPLMQRNKAQTVQMAQGFPGCMEALAFSHTAYDGQYPPVGKDHATLLRAKGFEEAGVADPLVVRAAVYEGLMDLPKTSNYDKYREKGQVSTDGT